MTEPTPGTRSIELSIEVPGSPEAVWEAIGTGPGITSWFVPHALEERTGGAYTCDFGEGFGTFPGVVAAWEPPGRVVLVSGDGDHELAYEWLVEAQDGGTCVVRLVNSGFGDGEEWDGEYDGMAQGWRVFLLNLRAHLVHGRGRAARALTPTAMAAGPHAAAWTRLCSTLGVPEDLLPGDRFEARGDGVPALAGVVETVLDEPTLHLDLVLLDTPFEGRALVLVEGEGDQVGASLYLYLHDAEGAADVWSAWFRTAMAAPT